MSKAKVKAKISNRILRSNLLERERIVFGFVFALVVIFAVTLAAVYMILGANMVPKESVKIVTPLNVDAMATDEVKTEEGVAVKDYEAVLNTKWYFKAEDNTYASNAYVENSRYNKYKVCFNVALNDSPDDILYTSKVLSVGDKVRGVRLNKKLPEGIYEATVTYIILDDLGNEAGNVKTGITLYIGEAADVKSE